MKIILCGYNWAGCKALDLLLKDMHEHEVFVYTHTSAPYVNDLENFCKKKNVKYSLDKISLSNLPFTPDVIISIYYRYIIKKDIIEVCNHKIFNLHPSLLPKYKGCSSLTWAMVNGETKAGYTYHYINEGVDSGNIILQKEFKIEDFDTQVTLYHRIMFEAVKDLLTVIDLVISNFEGYPQDNSLKTHFYKRGCPYDGIINEQWDDITIDNFIRAMIYPPLSPAKFKNQDVYRLKDFKQIICPE